MAGKASEQESWEVFRERNWNAFHAGLDLSSLPFKTLHGRNTKAYFHLARYFELVLFGDDEANVGAGREPASWFQELADEMSAAVRRANPKPGTRPYVIDRAERDRGILDALGKHAKNVKLSLGDGALQVMIFALTDNAGEPASHHHENLATLSFLTSEFAQLVGTEDAALWQPPDWPDMPLTPETEEDLSLEVRIVAMLHHRARLLLDAWLFAAESQGSYTWSIGILPEYLHQLAEDAARARKDFNRRYFRDDAKLTYEEDVRLRCLFAQSELGLSWEEVFEREELSGPIKTADTLPKDLASNCSALVRRMRSLVNHAGDGLSLLSLMSRASTIAVSRSPIIDVATVTRRVSRGGGPKRRRL